MTIIYVISKIFTFPGTFMKGFLEHIVCRAFKVNIYAADKYVSTTPLSGHVSMLSPESASKSFFVCFFPGVLNFLLAVGGYLSSAAALGYLGVRIYDPMSGSRTPLFFVYCLLFYICASLMCNLFPYVPNAKHMWAKLYGKESRAGAVAKIFAFIPAVIMLVGAYAEKYALTFLINVAAAAFMFWYI